MMNAKASVAYTSVLKGGSRYVVNSDKSTQRMEKRTKKVHAGTEKTERERMKERKRGREIERKRN
jgi:hypothetical protein